MNLKIVLVIFLSIAISLTVLYIFNDFIRSSYDISKAETDWYIQNSNSETKKVYLVGGSHVANLNSTHVVKMISEEVKVELYNLWKPADFIEKRIPNLDNLISTKPTLVVIGVRYMDFSSTRPSNYDPNQKISNSIVDLIISSKEKLELSRQQSVLNIDLNNFKNPKLSTLNFISQMENKNKPGLDEFYWKSFSKFSKGTKNIQPIYDMEGTEDFPFKNSRYFLGKIKDDSQGVLALKIMIEEFKENNIDVIIYSTLHHDKFRETMTMEDIQKFRAILNDISAEYKINVEFLDDRYSHLKIWSNYDHVAINPKGLTYSEDVANFILKQDLFVNPNNEDMES